MKKILKKIKTIFVRSCTHCGSTNLKESVERLPNYGSTIIETTYTCKDCGAFSRKSKTYTRGEELSKEHKSLLNNRISKGK